MADEPERPDARRQTVLVLEDDPGILLLQRRSLERAGYRVIAVSNPVDAAQAVERESPDLLVLDYQLGRDRTGLDFYRQMRDRGIDAPAILVTSFSDEGRAIEALRAGISDVVPKVGDYLEYLHEAARRVLSQVSAARRLAETEAASRAKDHFIAVLSHELRTPLTPVLTAVQILQAAPDLPANLRDPVEVVRRNVDLEVRLIDDLLDLTRVSSGKLELQLAPTDVHEKLRNAIQIVESDLRARRISLECRFEASRVCVQADAARLQQIFWNLLKNAVKFTPEGGAVRIRTADAPDGRLRIEIQDTGVGIDPAVLPRIFNAFEQGGRNVTRQFGGLGLGLSISRNLVEMHGGTLTAGSEGPGRGATFTVNLPAVAPSAETSKPGDGDSPARGARNLRILLVEDHEDTARLMARLLRAAGHRVAAANSVSSALQAAGAETFDVVISDIGLPDGSGLDLMRQLRTRHPMRGIALSGFGMEDDIRRSHEAGFAEHLTKPVDPRHLQAVLRKLVPA